MIRPEQPPHVVCRVCHTTLETVRHYEAGTLVETLYRHTSAVEHRFGKMGHDPDPILAEGVELVGVCDFCTAASPTWRYRCRSFDMFHALKEDGATVTGTSDDDWAACDRCHKLIECDDWDAITEIAIAEHGVAGEVAAPALYILHANFRANRIGEAIPA